MPKLGLGGTIGKQALTTPGIISSDRTVWAPFDSPGQTGTAYTGKALDFDGVAAYIDLNSDYEDWLEQDVKTFAAWVKNDGSSSQQRVFNVASNDSGGATGFSFGFYKTSGTVNMPYWF